MPLLAVIVIPNAPASPAVPAMVAVPFPLSVKVTPEGRVPDAASAGVGYPDVVTVNVPGVPLVKVVPLALVMDGAWSTVSVKLCVAFGEAVLLAVMVNV
jgi:hypothetical protein